MSKKSSIGVVLTVLIVLLAGGLAYIFMTGETGPAEQTRTEATSPQNTQEMAKPSVSGDNAPTDRQPDETTDWPTYRNSEYGFELKYPPRYGIVSGWLWGDLDVHFVDPDNTGIHVSAERTDGNYCFLGFCAVSAKSQLTVNGISWDYLGQQGYADAGASTEGRFIYRTIHGKYRFYVHFDAEGPENELVMQSFRFFL